MPQMDSNGMKKGLVDPYCTVQFAGHKEETRFILDDQDPQWNQQINLPIRVSCLSRSAVFVLHIIIQFPSMCERICFQLMDKYICVVC